MILNSIIHNINSPTEKYDDELCGNENMFWGDGMGDVASGMNSCIDGKPIIKIGV